ncbi:MAG TPA: DNA starvation/stationary phase protection protein [Cryomorphaceae bacterium]|nr:DNA starvation/stationary phase protection protein [Owenweeksia sp.]HAD98747.1 DNA starvation/stationary phase protection protein [Cryomorphaceae bacterium]HBF20019.1 DNA starvation/stationary phase protection protein [Cryomorphaceae bacterium]HCQ15365.1 DNA starvation/stationary phase protection protein [Cryomorphaceae bacterium]|tara:strand:- start:171 stop:692 length:522 start_codon:yes stop_codon:yes gene_type:complete
MEKVELKEVKFPNSHRKIELHTGLEENDRKSVADKLSEVLADSYLLMLKTHYYHWNVKGTLFKSLHDLTEQQYTELFEAIDDIAERIRALGFEAPGTFSIFQKISNVKEAKSGLSDLEMSADLLETHESLILKLRETLKTADEISDEVTVDMMVSRLTIHEKAAWMLRSFIER